MSLDPSPPAVGLVIVTHNNLSAVTFLTGLPLLLQYPRLHTVIVDSGSTDGTSSALSALASKDLCVIQVENRGFGAACHAGIQSLPECEFFALLNPDAMPEQNWIADMVRELSRHPAAGVAFAQTPYPGETRASGGRVTATAQGPGAAMFIRAATWRELQGFDKAMFLYWEDTDFCWRAWLHDWQVLHVSSSLVYHERGGSSGGVRRWAAEQSRNGTYVIWSLLPFWSALWLWVGLLLRAVIRGLLWRDANVLSAPWHPPVGWRNTLVRRDAYRERRQLRGRDLAAAIHLHRRAQRVAQFRRVIRLLCAMNGRETRRQLGL